MWHSFCLKWNSSGLVTEVFFIQHKMTQFWNVLWWTCYSQILSRPSSGTFSSLLFSPHYSSLHLWLSMPCTHLLCSILYSYVPDSSSFFRPFKTFPLCYTVDSCYCPVAKLCLIHWDPMGCSMPGSSGILSPRVCSNSHPLRQWCYLAISSSVIPFSFCLQSSGSFPMSLLFILGGQYFGASAST